MTSPSGTFLQQSATSRCNLADCELPNTDGDASIEPMCTVQCVTCSGVFYFTAGLAPPANTPCLRLGLLEEVV
jgi:hypothetical protein